MIKLTLSIKSIFSVITSFQTLNNSRFKLTFLLVMLFLMEFTLLQAQSYENRAGDSINPLAYVKAGFYYPNMRTSLRVDGGLLGTEVSLEETLRLDEDLGVFRADAFFRLTKRSSLVGSYTYIKRSNSLTLPEDIRFEDIVFEKGSGVYFNFDVDYIAATYRYNIINQLNRTVGVSAGLRGVIINTEAVARLNEFSERFNASFIAPALLLGVHYSAYLAPRLLVRYALEGLYLEIQGTKINIIESNASINWFMSRTFGIGLAYSTNNYRVREIPFSEDFSGKINFSFGGLNLFLVVRM